MVVFTFVWTVKLLWWSEHGSCFLYDNAQNWWRATRALIIAVAWLYTVVHPIVRPAATSPRWLLTALLANLVVTPGMLGIVLGMPLALSVRGSRRRTTSYWFEYIGRIPGGIDHESPTHTNKGNACIYRFLAFVCALYKFGRRARAHISTELMASIYDKASKMKVYSRNVDKDKVKKVEEEKTAENELAKKKRKSGKKAKKEKSAKADDLKASKSMGMRVRLAQRGLIFSAGSRHDSLGVVCLGPGRLIVVVGNSYLMVPVTRRAKLVLPGTYYLICMLDDRIYAHDTLKDLRVQGILGHITHDAEAEAQKDQATVVTTEEALARAIDSGLLGFGEKFWIKIALSNQPQNTYGWIPIVSPLTYLDVTAKCPWWTGHTCWNTAFNHNIDGWCWVGWVMYYKCYGIYTIWVDMCTSLLDILKAGQHVGLLGQMGSNKPMPTANSRQRTFIPQNATLFSGTLRDNLDPFGPHLICIVVDWATTRKGFKE
ncbi:hypothetical protein P691DRAFT_791646 [Macrolepiota fuliginosa MF-IS2]|uniref:Uncharacterized protein n=1 Tax=Macrolepiota fuliginosa MF-IS2 TaxID=1400762 RepID=A0A9P6BVZ9_9AGAR|nr:hypothetical protein P691DRAFT_791646 [Macrolepiota fuliginosa MF-IS2]